MHILQKKPLANSAFSRCHSVFSAVLSAAPGTKCAYPPEYAIHPISLCKPFRLIISAFPFSRRMQRNRNDQPDTSTDRSTVPVCVPWSVHTPSRILSDCHISYDTAIILPDHGRTAVLFHGQKHAAVCCSPCSILPLLLPEAYRISYSNALSQKKVSCAHRTDTIGTDFTTHRTTGWI